MMKHPSLRDRTVRLLNEKDRELETFRQLSSTSIRPAETNLSLDLPMESPTILTELFPHASTIGGPGTSAENNSILYFVQEQQMREQEVSTLRKQRYDLRLVNCNSVSNNCRMNGNKGNSANSGTLL